MSLRNSRSDILRGMLEEHAMRATALALVAALVALPALAQQSPAPAPGVPTTPHQTETLRQPRTGDATGTPATTPPTAGGGSAPATPHQSEVLRGRPQQDSGSEPSGGRMPTRDPQRR
jgi:hypothetical protein